jgi:organic radical activating enzyme
MIVILTIKTWHHQHFVMWYVERFDKVRLDLLEAILGTDNKLEPVVLVCHHLLNCRSIYPSLFRHARIRQLHTAIDLIQHVEQIILYYDGTIGLNLVVTLAKESGRVHIIWTGGEPTIPKHQRAIVAFDHYLDEYCLEKTGFFCKSYNEIETNGTIIIQDDLFDMLNQINCSVKLANSGMSKKRRINAAAIEKMMTHENYWFKFVISTEDCLKEIETDFIKPFNIPHDKVLMMPGLDSQDNYHERTRFSLEMAKKYGYIGMSRLHVSAWDKLTGV